jgi:hypothetical protein
MTYFVEINTGAFYRNVAIVGTFEVVNDGVFTAWNGDTRRVGNAGAGYVKVLGLNTYNAKPVKVTVAGADAGYVVRTEAEMVALYAELGADAEATDMFADVAVAEVTVSVEDEKLVALRAAFEAATGAERAMLRKRLRRAEAKLVA